MKTLSLITIVTGTVLAFTARAGILGSPHDFSAQSWNNDPADPSQVCSTCHTPHHADSTIVPLWSHGITASSFTMYNNANVSVADLQMTVDAQPAGPSKACLSCHDGTVAINTYGGTTRGTATFLTNSASFGTDLTHSHPISMVYDPAKVGSGVGQDKWLFDPDATPVLVPDSQPTFVPGNDMTINGFLLGGNHRLECTSCHDVHNQEGTPFDITTNPKLVKINGTQAGVGSLLCRSCHNK
jgi:hypothetical protein